MLTRQSQIARVVKMLQSISQFARAKKVARQQVDRWLRQGRLHSVTIGGHRFIDSAAKIGPRKKSGKKSRKIA
jgi:hypothetical protein